MKTGTAEIAVRDLFMPAKVATRSGFFLYMSLGFLAVALIGFSTTFFLPLARGTFVAPPIVYAHGVLLFAWLIFFIAQASLIRVRNVSCAPPARLVWSLARHCRRDLWRRRVVPQGTQRPGSGSR